MDSSAAYAARAYDGRPTGCPTTHQRSAWTRGSWWSSWDQQEATDLDRVRGYLRAYAHRLSEACEVTDLLAAVPDGGYGSW